MNKSSEKPSERPTDLNQLKYTSEKSKKVKKRGCGCGKKKRRS